MTGGRSSGAGGAGRSLRMERLSRIYFSEGDEGPGEGRTPAPVAFLPVLNCAGERGGRAIEAIRRSLARESVSSFFAASRGDGYVLPGEEGGAMEGAALLARLRQAEAPGVFFLMMPEDGTDRELRLLCRGDTPLLLVESGVESLRRAYVALKRLGGIERGTLPAILSVSPRREAWDGLAPRRLAEAAEEFLHRRVTVWDGDGPDRIAGRIAGALERMGARRESGMDPLLRRIAPCIEGNSEE